MSAKEAVYVGHNQESVDIMDFGCLNVTNLLRIMLVIQSTPLVITLWVYMKYRTL